MADRTTAPESTVPLAPAPTPRKPRWGRRLGILFLLLLVLLAVVVWAAPGLIAKSSYKDRLIAEATKDLNGRVEVGAVSLAWFHPIELYDVTLFDADGRRALTAAKVTTSRTLLDFARDRSELGTIVVNQPRAEVMVKNGTTNIEQVIAKYLNDTTPAKPDRTPIRIEVTNGVVVLIDAERNETRELTAVNMTVGVPKSRTEPISLSVAATSGGTLSADGAFGTGIKGKLKANGFDAASLGPIVRRFDSSTVLAGLLTSDLTAEWNGGEWDADGTLAATDLAVGGGWLNGDVLKLKAAELPVKLVYTGGKLVVEHAKLTCDFGTASFRGTVDTVALDKMPNYTGLKLDADVDVARLATLLPNLLRLRPGTELTGGRVRAKLESTAGPIGPVWTGSIDTTKLEGRRDGKPLSWDQPLAVTFQGRVRKDGLPAFDDLTVQSDFIGGRARGEPEAFDAAVNLELDRLSTHLNDFLNLNGLNLNGSVRNLIVQTRPKANGGYTLTANGTVSNLVVLDRDGKGLRESSLTLKANADGDLLKQTDGTYVRIDGGSFSVNAGTDSLNLTLVEPIADLKSLSTGLARVNLTGDLAQWRARLGPVIGFPKEWELGGTARQATAVVSLGDVITAKQVRLGVTNARFRGVGLDVDEPDLTLTTSDPDGGAITYDRKTGTTAFLFATLASNTISGSTKRFEIKPNANGEYGASGRANVVAKLDRLQRTLKLQSDPTLADQFRGTAEGWIDLQAPTFDRLGLNGDLTVKGFEYGPPKAPIWTEQWVRARLDGEYQLTADSMLFRTAEVSRDGFSANGKGRLDKLTTAVELDLSGDLTYDLSKLEPQLKQYLGKSAAAVGKDTKPFRVAGNLLDGGKNLNVAVGGKPAGKSDLTRLNGNAAVAWQSLKAYGFDVGQSEVKATVDQGLVSMTPVEAAFGGGKVRLEPSLKLNPGAYDLTFKKGKVIDTAKLTPAVCAEAVGYALPAFANSAQADGTISFELADNLIPLADPTHGVVKGNLTIHDATVAPGPVVTQVIEVFGMATPKLQVKKGSVVPVRLENGRVHHTNFVVNVGNTPISTTGSVGVDGSLDMTVSVPVGSTLAEKLVPGNRPLIHKAIAQQTITVAINGTLSKPALNREAMQGQLAKIVKGAMNDAVKDAGGNLADDLLKKGLDGLLKPKK